LKLQSRVDGIEALAHPRLRIAGVGVECPDFARDERRGCALPFPTGRPSDLLPSRLSALSPQTPDCFHGDRAVPRRAIGTTLSRPNSTSRRLGSKRYSEGRFPPSTPVKMRDGSGSRKSAELDSGDWFNRPRRDSQSQVRESCRPKLCGISHANRRLVTDERR
jgi:hypothetical protein